jgi:DNA-binding NarL/FixJ family response regulator
LRGLTLETVRTYVKAMLRKTEQHSQAQLESRNEANAAWP